ncbi:MAG: dihydrodipicolinate synthase family protein [Gammaproteobacteria bacterium]|nr:dihydrodipicolinate synthase family protein [Gammaproteobacteria bacterium]
MTKRTLTGIIAYTVTPFSSHEEVNLEALNILIDDLIDSGADAIAALGSAGECAYLDDDEWALVASHTIEYVNGRVPVIIGISELTTKKAVSRAIFSNGLGADAIMVSPFSYYRLSEDEIYEHYATISQAVSIPIMIYNNPATCGVDMSPEFMLSMVNDIDNATMIKESSGDIQRMRKLQRLSKGSVPFFNGCNYLALDAFNAGAVGWCTAAPCLLGSLPKRLLDEVNNGKAEIAKLLFEQQLPLLEFIVAGGLASTVKAGLEIKGLSVGLARRPLKPLTSDRKQALKKIMTSIESDKDDKHY